MYKKFHDRFSRQITKCSFYTLRIDEREKIFKDYIFFAEITTERYDVWQFSRQITKVSTLCDLTEKSFILLKL